MGFHTIGVYELWNMVLRQDVYLIDLRDRCEYRKFHIRGAANLPYEEMAGWQKGLPREKKLVLYCERGSTSMRVAKQLAQQGYEVYTLVGGIHALNE